MLQTPIGRLRFVGVLEGISYLLLLGIAMPLKYFADYPLAVTLTGAIHGILFVLFVGALAQVTWKYRWSIKKVAGAFIASILPFGTFVLDSKLKHEETK